jgi:hypothetical protein
MPMTRPKLVAFALLAAVALAACTRPNPDACCTNQEECLALGSTELRPCAGGKVCSNNTCLAAQCTTAAECSAAAPYCSNQLCVASCRGDGDCVGIAGAPICAPDGVCVGCRNNGDCSGATAICDAEDRTCRGCEADSDCASGICLEADGVCATEAETVYVNSAGGTDSGTCTRLQPCQSLQYAFSKADAARPVIRASGGAATIAATLNPGSKYIYLDAAPGVQLQVSGGASPVFSVGNGGRLTIENAGFPNIGKVSVSNGGNLRLSHVTVQSGTELFAEITGAQLQSIRSELGRLVSCSLKGTVVALDSVLGAPNATGVVGTDTCEVQIKRTKIVAQDHALSIEGGRSIVENALIMTSNAGADLVLIRNLETGSRFQFNTIYNSSGSEFTGVAIACDASANAAYNVIAYMSSSPTTGCPTRYTLYDKTAGFVAGEGNVVANSGTFFIDPSRQDFRPSSTSPARGMAEPTTTTVIDFNGNPRPQPAGSRPDVGAFEVP